MIKKRQIRGRQTLALVVTLDAIFLVVLAFLLLTALDVCEKYDMALLLVHALHLFSAFLSYVIIRHSSTIVDSLRIILLVYLVLLIVDVAVLFARIAILLHTSHAHKSVDQSAAAHDATFVRFGAMKFTAISRILLVIYFILIDVAAVIYGNWAQSSAFIQQYSNEQLLSVASRALRQQNTNTAKQQTDRERRNSLTITSLGNANRANDTSNV